MTLVDLSHPITDGMITYPGLPGPAITDHLSREESRSRYAPGYEFQIGQICMLGNSRALPWRWRAGTLSIELPDHLPPAPATAFSIAA